MAKIDSGPLEATDKFEQVSKDKWRTLMRAKRDFLSTNLAYDCRCLVEFCEEAELVYSDCGFTSAAEMIQHGYELDPVEIELAVAWLKHNQPKQEIALQAITKIADKIRQLKDENPNWTHWRTKMSWIKFETATSEKPEVWAMAQSLGIDADAVVGKLLRVWAWFDTQTVEGNAPSVTKALLDSKVCVSGFCQAMISVGWMIEKDGRINLPNFDRHNGKTAKNRGLTSKRVAGHKASNGKVTQKGTQQFEKGNASSVTSALPKFEKGNASSVTSALPREEKRREEVIIPPVSPKGERSTFKPESVFFPSEIDTPEVRTAWQSWCQHRREIKKPITPTSAVKQLGQLAVAGPQRAVAIIEHTIAKGWQGLQEPDCKANGHPQPPTINDRLSNIRLEDYPQ